MMRLGIYMVMALALWGPGPVRADNPVGELREQNRMTEALKLCRQAETLSSYDKSVLIDCAWVFYRTNRIESADKMLDKLRGSMNSPEFQLVSTFGLIKKKEYPKAREVIDSLAKRYRGTALHVQVQVLSGELYEALGQLDTAAFVYMQIVGDSPNLGRAQWGLGRYYLSRKDTGRAKKHLMETARLWPTHLGSRYNLALLSLAEDRLGDAARWLAECYRLDKADVGVLEQLGLLFERKGNLAVAIKHWQRAVAINPRTRVAREKLNKYVTGVLDQLIEQGKFDEALEQINGSPTRNTPEMALRRGLIFRQIGKYELAVPEFLKYVPYNPRSGLALRELGVCYLNLKLLDQAGQSFAQATAVEPDNGMNFAWLAFALEGKGELEKAREAWVRAIRLFQDPLEVQKGQRRLASIEKRLKERSENKKTE